MEVSAGHRGGQGSSYFNDSRKDHNQAYQVMFSGTVNALAPLLLSRVWHGSIAVGDTGYVFGGMAGGTPTAVTEKWSLSRIKRQE